jgi:hypothetical protein
MKKVDTDTLGASDEAVVHVDIAEAKKFVEQEKKQPSLKVTFADLLKKK